MGAFDYSLKTRNIPPAPTSIISGASYGQGCYVELNNPIGKLVYAGVITANTPILALSITGAGCLKFFAVTNGNYALNHKIKITIDGTVALNSQATAASPGEGLIAVGYLSTPTAATNKIYQMDYVYFHRQLLIEYASANSSNSGTWFVYAYEVY